MENRQRLSLFAGPFFPSCPYIVHPVLPAYSARRSRTPERSESVSEEAACILYDIFSLRAGARLCTSFMWQLCVVRPRCYILSQYTLR